MAAADPARIRSNPSKKDHAASVNIGRPSRLINAREAGMSSSDIVVPRAIGDTEWLSPRRGRTVENATGVPAPIREVRWPGPELCPESVVSP
jgi:hypothetical protein